jgi:lycopene cyclase domain-containing protein
MKNAYLIIDLLIIAIPLLLTFFPSFKFYRRYKALFLSILIVGGLFLWWDVAVTARGDWSFNNDFILGTRVMGLPLEELLFFIAVPYSCLFLYEALRSRIIERDVKYNRNLYLILAAVAFLSSFLFRSNSYTSLVLLILRFIFSSFIYWIWMVTCMFLFFLFNHMLTGLPAVTYNPAAILNIRISTVPIEDIFYNFSILTCYLAFYLFFRGERAK